jgi:hypothetical protein
MDCGEVCEANVAERFSITLIATTGASAVVVTAVTVLHFGVLLLPLSRISLYLQPVICYQPFSYFR